ncbi:hypothetical protein HAX54_018089 [Datura stramonium]|uniref:Uncharacterized protein n=1 Tax=Datura stramonium TaxID=4076 RepID=A0ABS8Y8D3_DATST|nr:hypothetical protein [Datura stramonium]
MAFSGNQLVDEDFFDKLVNDYDDDVGFKVITSLAGSNLATTSVYVDGNKSCEVKAISNLSISDDVNGGVDSISGDTRKEVKKLDKGVDCNIKLVLKVERN